MLDRYVYVNQKKLRCGYTTGTCAAGAAKAAAKMLIEKENVTSVKICTPKGLNVFLDIEDVKTDDISVSCAVRKDGGDDIDATNGALIYASVQKTISPEIIISGGEGVGIVTKPGLNQPVGEYAINSVPRRMIAESVREIVKRSGYGGGLKVIISVPKGKEIAGQTFNSNIGIEGGISILGTSGIVEPMSEKALIDTIRIEMNMKKAAGQDSLLVTPGNYGIDFIKMNTRINYENAVKCSNYVGEILDMAVEMKFERFLFVGNIGKLVKIGAGIMNTHSHNADARMEILAACAVEGGIQDINIIRGILECNTTEEAVEKMKNYKVCDDVMACLIKRIDRYMNQRTGGKVETAAVVFSNRYGLLCESENVADIMKSFS